MDIKVIRTPNLKRNYTFSSKFMGSVGEALKKKIQVRAQAGVDINNKKFKKYSTGYANHKGVARTQVDLKVSGDMLRKIKVKSTKNTTTINATDYKGKYHQYMGAGRGKVKRVWFGSDKGFRKRVLPVLMNREFHRLNKKRVT